MELPTNIAQERARQEEEEKKLGISFHMKTCSRSRVALASLYRVSQCVLVLLPLCHLLSFHLMYPSKGILYFAMRCRVCALVHSKAAGNILYKMNR